MGQSMGSAQFPNDFITHDVPAGYDTVWGWTAKWSPQDLPPEPDLKTAFADEIHALMQQSAANGYSVVSVAAPVALRALGANSIPAFETSLLYMMSRS